MRHTKARSLQPMTNAILDFLVDHPYAPMRLIMEKLGFPRSKVQAVYYQYGFTGSAKAKKKFYTMWVIGEEIRKKWPAKDLVAQAESKPQPVKPSAVTWPDEDLVNQSKRVYVELAKKQGLTTEQEPTKGQVVLRDTLAKDDAEIAKLRAEIYKNKIIIEFLLSQRATA